MAKIFECQGDEEGTYRGIARFLHTKKNVDDHIEVFVKGLKLKGGLADLEQEVDKFARGLYKYIPVEDVKLREALELYFIKIQK